jgi:CDP-4-dehydro-6-deoxyglucose reductase
MTFQITVQPSGHQFTCEADETVLSAAIRAGIGLPYGCKNGACGSCKGKVLEGELSHKPHQQRALSDIEKAQGMSLFCCSKPVGDIVIEQRELSGFGDIPIRKMPCRIARIERPAPDVAIVSLQLPANERLQFRAGQFLEFILKDGRRRSYSMATPPSENNRVELHIRHMPGGAFTDHVFGAGATQMKLREIQRVEGPFGSFFLRDDSDKPIVFLASGTGFAPIKAIIERMAQQEVKRPAVLYWGGRRPQDLYMHAKAEEWARTLPGFSYVPVVSDAKPEDNWQGRTGFVHRAVMEDLPDLSGHQVYACGAPIMVDSARKDFTRLNGLPAEEFYADAFTSEADLV